MKTVCSPLVVWEDKFRKDTLIGRDFREHWKLHVPRLYAPDERTNFLHTTSDDDQSQVLFFEPLKQFIFSENPNETLKHLKALATPTSLCGRVFHMGEATYSCKDCGQDSTCVLCRDCFKASVHQQHRYKINQSVGGGYCDCGDREAWRDAAACSIHTNSASGQSECVNSAAAALAKFPPEIVARARAVFSAVLEYALEVLTLENSVNVPRDLRSPPENVLDGDDLLTGGEAFHPPLYSTIFFNDETHTFDQVIECLRRAVDCTQREAVDYATIIDRVGRCIVKCGDFQTCYRAKQVFDSHSSRHYIRPYKVQLMHTHVVAHQTFAMKLLVWLKRLIEEVDGFKTLFAQIVTEGTPDGPLVERVMKRDIQLWKQARNQWHLLLIQGMLMENDSKKVFAKTFTRLYPNLMLDFMSDDHNHSDSVTSLSVQIYTVPTLAYMLITGQDCLHVVTRTFYHECRSRLDTNGVLSFDSNNSDFEWRRISYCLNDLRYLLSVRPAEWDDQLRSGFLHGFNAILDVLSVMEGMDASIRQTGSHLEFDPEWQTAFTLFGKLSMVICHLIDWCSSDRIVMIRAYQALLRKLYSMLTPERMRPSACVEAGTKRFTVINFDVWLAPVSLHLPLTRLLAGLHLHLAKFGLTFDCSELAIDNRPTIQQVMEMSLRAVILTTQVRAGMWRRNGTSLISQVHFYSNVRIRSEIQDRDVQILQMAAALEDADEFVMTVLLRYNIHHWLSDEFEAKIRQNTDSDGECMGSVYPQSIQEFIHNLEEAMLVFIHVFGERYQPGIGAVSKEDCIRKEIIQALCIESTPHSKLCKLVMAESQDVSVEQIAAGVADFRTPTLNSGKGVYELKPEYLSDYNPFWYHYTREEQSRAEGTQRRRKLQSGQTPCLPPPMLPPFTTEFHNVRNIATCAAMISVVRTVLLRATDLHARVFSETLVHRTLFFMGMALNEERRKPTSHVRQEAGASSATTTTTTSPPTAATASCDAAAAGNAPLDLRVLMRSCDDTPASSSRARHASDECSSLPLDLSFCFSQLCQHAGILELLENLSRSARVSSHADLLGWISARLWQQLGLPLASPSAASASQSSTASSSYTSSSSLSSSAAALQKKRADAAARRARILRQMEQQQMRFSRRHGARQESTDSLPVQTSTSNATAAAVAVKAADSAQSPPVDFLQTSEVIADGSDSSMVSTDRLRGSNMDLSEHCASVHAQSTDCLPVCLGPRQTDRSTPTVSTSPHTADNADFTCILCQASESTISAERPTMVLAALVQPSTVLSRRLRHRAATGLEPPTPAPQWSRLLLDSELHRLPHISSCGHSMHASCWKRHFENVCQRERRRALRLRQNNVFDVSKHEFLCPLCQCLSNTVIPLVPPRIAAPPKLELPPSLAADSHDGFTAWITALQLACDHTLSAMPVDGKDDFMLESSSVKFAAPSLKSILEQMNPVQAKEFEVLIGLGDVIPEMSNTTREMINTFTMVPMMVGGQHEQVQFGDARLPLLTLHALAYTLHATEQQARHSARPLFASLGSRCDTCLTQLTHLASVMLPAVVDLATAQRCSARLLWLLVGARGPSFLTVDAVGAMVTLSSLVAALFCSHFEQYRAPSGSWRELQCLRMCLLMHLLQIVLPINSVAQLSGVAGDEAVAMDTDDDDGHDGGDHDEGESLWQLYVMARGAASLPPAPHISPSLLCAHVRRAVTPFLRCVALYLHLVSGVRASEELRSSDWHEERHSDTHVTQLLSYLGVSSLSIPAALQSGSSVNQLVVSWCSSSETRQLLSNPGSSVVDYPLKVNTLVSLPEDFSELINKVSDFTCPSSEGESRVPAMCLACGQLLCSQSYCCQVQVDGVGQIGACNAHLLACGASIGVMLRIRECRVHLLVNNLRGANYLPPYVDKFGEVDQGLQRGNPLTLWREQYERINKLWMTHGIAEEVTRQMEDAHSPTDWQNL